MLKVTNMITTNVYKGFQLHIPKKLDKDII